MRNEPTVPASQIANRPRKNAEEPWNRNPCCETVPDTVPSAI